MRKIIILCSIMCFLLCSCQNKQVKNTEGFPSEFEFGVIETTGYKQKSFITYYNENMEEIYQTSYPYGTMNLGFGVPNVYENELYTIPQGLGNEKDLEMIMELDLETGATKKYKFKDRVISDVVATQTDLYVVSNLNGVSYVDHYNKATGEVRTIESEMQNCFYWLCWANETLYVFTSNDDDQVGDFVYEIEPKEFKITKTMDITNIGYYHCGFLEYNGKLYFTTDSKKGNNINHLSSLSFATGEIETLKLPKHSPMEIFEENGLFYIAHCDFFGADRSGSITVFHPETEKMENYKLTHRIARMGIQNGNIYICDTEKVYLYRLENEALKLQKSVDIATQKDNKTHFYTSGFFLNPKHNQ